MSICAACSALIESAAISCSKCGAWNLSPSEASVFNGRTIKASELVDAIDVESSHIEHITTGPWDGVFGGGPVPGTTALICGLAGGGKGQPLDAIVMSPRGERRMGELRIGSQVCNPDGSAARVIAIHELGRREIFRVTFSDGSSTRVTGDHLWLMWRARRVKKRGSAKKLDASGDVIHGRLATTEQLREYIDGTGPPIIPLTSPVALNTAKGSRPIDPYVLGVLLGDGGMTQPQIMLTSADREIVCTVEKTLGVKLKSSNGSISYRFPVSTGVREGLTALGLCGKSSHQKFVPRRYKWAPVSTRIALVRGLMDMDGTVGATGRVSFTSVSKRLAHDMRWLLHSLGYRSHVYTRRPTFRDANGDKKLGRLAYTLNIQGRSLSDLFLLRRKRKRCASCFNGGVSEPGRRMVSIKSCGVAEARCIVIDHPNGLYLTDDFIVTHNSTLILQISTILAQLSGKPAFYISGEQSAAELKFTLDRLQIKLERGQLRLAKSMGSSGLIDDAVLAAAPPSSVIVDSLTELCGQKQYDAQVALAKAYKEPVAIKYRCPVFLISQMGKSGDTFGMAALQHGPDTLIEVQVIDDGRRRARILREYGLIDGDVRLAVAFKNRFGPTHQDFPLLMTEHGFTAIPKAMKRTRKRTGDPLKDVVLEIQWLEEDIENERGTIREMREELSELREKMWKLAGEKPKSQGKGARRSHREGAGAR